MSNHDDPLAALAERLIEDAHNMTADQTLNMALKHVVQVADAIDYRALSIALCPGHKDVNGHIHLHGDVFFRANDTKDVAHLIWFIVDTFLSAAVASPPLNPLAPALHDLRKHIEDVFGIPILRSDATEIVNSTGVHEVDQVDRGRPN